MSRYLKLLKGARISKREDIVLLNSFIKTSTSVKEFEEKPEKRKRLENLLLSKLIQDLLIIEEENLLNG